MEASLAQFDPLTAASLSLSLSKRPKSGGSVSSVGTGYREKSPVPSALSPTPQVLGASALQDALESPRNRHRESDDNENDNIDGRNDIDNPVFGTANDSRSYGATIKSTLVLAT